MPLIYKDGKFPAVTKLIQAAGGIARSANPRQVIVRRPQLGGIDLAIANDGVWVKNTLNALKAAVSIP